MAKQGGQVKKYGWVVGLVVAAGCTWTLCAFISVTALKSISPLAQYKKRCNELGGVVVEFLEHKTSSGGRQYNRTCIDPKMILDVK